METALDFPAIKRSAQSVGALLGGSFSFASRVLSM